MTAFILSCMVGTADVGSIYFRSVNDCIYYADKLSGQQIKTEEGMKPYECICKLVPYISKDKVRIY